MCYDIREDYISSYMICQKGGLVSFPFRKLPEHSRKRSTVAKSHITNAYQDKKGIFFVPMEALPYKVILFIGGA